MNLLRGVNSSNIQVTNGTLLSVTGSADIYTLTVSALEQTTVSIVLGDGIVDNSVNPINLRALH